MRMDECLIKLNNLEYDYKKTKREIEEKYKHDRASILNAWANENAEYDVGDIIEADGTAIVIEKIFGHRSELGSKANMYFVYYGRALTKRLQPRKDEWRTSIYDDGRIIKLIKHKEDSV